MHIYPIYSYKGERDKTVRTFYTHELQDYIRTCIHLNAWMWCWHTYLPYSIAELALQNPLQCLQLLGRHFPCSLEFVQQLNGTRYVWKRTNAKQWGQDRGHGQSFASFDLKMLSLAKHLCLINNITCSSKYFRM